MAVVRVISDWLDQRHAVELLRSRPYGPPAISVAALSGSIPAANLVTADALAAQLAVVLADPENNVRSA